MKDTGKPSILWGLLSLAAAFLLLPPSLAAGAGPDTPGDLPAAESSPVSGGAWIIPIRGDIEPSLAVFVRREGRRAQAQGARHIIFEIDTFGGRVDTALQITSFITSIKNARTVAWVNNGDESMGVSWSAGALIAFSCADIFMAGGTSMGAAAPVTVGPGGAAEAAGEKTVAAVRSQMAALAERNGHPPGIALAMVDMDVELWEAAVDGRTQILTAEELGRLEKAGPGGTTVERIGVISPPGKLLSLTSGEAVRYGLARGIADDRNGLLAALGVTAEIQESSPGFTDQIVSLLSSGPVQALLIILGLVMIFLEINTPGFGLPGVAAIMCFLAVFGSGLLLGQVGSLELILFLIGAGLLAVEIFILPGFGVVGISGIVLIGLSLILSMQDFVLPRFAWEWDLLGRNTVVVCIGIIAAVFGIVVIALLGPRIRIFDRLTLQTRITETAAGSLTTAGFVPAEDPLIAGPVRIENEVDYHALAGKTGVAVTSLRPVGKADFQGQMYTVEADNAFIEAGTTVTVTAVQGNQITVRRV
ncbi:MAG: nodulation protein NfeD [Treponema sp.]|jgi:membrane-bound serine protease (ClpP class)|nr:nodulation protein NfeD [Treponema sp.]